MLPLCTAAWRRERPSCKKAERGDQWEKGQKATSCTSACYLRKSCKFHSQHTTSLISNLHSCSLSRNRTTSSRPAHAAVNSGVQWCYQIGRRAQCQLGVETTIKQAIKMQIAGHKMWDYYIRTFIRNSKPHHAWQIVLPAHTHAAHVSSNRHTNSPPVPCSAGLGAYRRL